jgi:hypothetical protein
MNSDKVNELINTDYSEILKLLYENDEYKKIHNDNIRRIYGEKINREFKCITSLEDIYLLLKETKAIDKLMLKKKILTGSFCEDTNVNFQLQKIYHYFLRQMDDMDLGILYKIELFRNIKKCLDKIEDMFDDIIYDILYENDNVRSNVYSDYIIDLWNNFYNNEGRYIINVAVERGFDIEEIESMIIDQRLNFGFEMEE